MQHLCGEKAVVTVWDCRELAKAGIWMKEGLWLGDHFPVLVVPSALWERAEGAVGCCAY